MINGFFSPQSPEQVESGLTDEDWKVRKAFAERADFTLTPEQIERGLTDKDWSVRQAFAKRADFTPTQEQVEQGLTDAHWSVRQAFAKRADFTPTQEQVEQGLTDAYWKVCIAFAERTDFTPTPEQIERGLADVNSDVREAIQQMQRRNIAAIAASQATELNPAAARIMARQQQVLQESKGKQLPDVSRHVEAARKRNEDLERQQQQVQVDARKGRSL